MTDWSNKMKYDATEVKITLHPVKMVIYVIMVIYLCVCLFNEGFVEFSKVNR